MGDEKDGNTLAFWVAKRTIDKSCARHSGPEDIEGDWINTKTQSLHGQNQSNTG